jgi:hypothetical protein
MRRIVRNATRAAFGCAVLGSVVLGAAARAQPPSHKLVLAGYADGPQGSALLAGRYDAVILRLAAHGMQFEEDEVSASTNLCVAYVATRRWRSADTACDEALEDARLDARAPTAPTLSVRLACNEEVAVAYSNRAVLELIEGRVASAAGDMARARALSSAESISQNSSAVGMLATAVAAATPAPRSSAVRVASP